MGARRRRLGICRTQTQKINDITRALNAPHFSLNRLTTVEWKSVEHYYQAAKARDVAGAEWVRSAGTPGEAKRRGRKIPLRDDWETVKIPVMRNALALKFAPDTQEAAYLRSTEDFVLVEGNDWGDIFWGVAGGFGQNWLGYLLMAQRGYLIALFRETI